MKRLPVTAEFVCLSCVACGFEALVIHCGLMEATENEEHSMLAPIDGLFVFESLSTLLAKGAQVA